jgi:pyruvate,water dikinase
MYSEYILDFTNPKANINFVGGKGASLARLALAEMPVPGGFYVTTNAYDQFVKENKLQQNIEDMLENTDPSSSISLQETAKKIHESFMETEMPEDISQAIDLALSEFPEKDTPFAIRSSATAEDLPDLSFAGQQDTFLNIKGSESIKDAVKRCWASLWTARAIAYRFQNSIDHMTVKLAVVVQSLVPAESAGVLFTLNPLNGDPDQIMINAVWGLGESIVGGSVTPDTITVNKAKGEIDEYETGDKKVWTVQSESGTSERPTPKNLRHKAVLNPADVEILSTLGIEIEKLYGTPMDVEWVFANGEFYIIQARPVTVLPEPPIPSDWTLHIPRGVAMRNNIVELMAEPLTPLFRTLGLEAINTSMRNTMAEFLGPGLLPEELIITVNDYAYYNGSFSTKQILKIFLKSPQIMKTMFTRPVERWTEEGHPEYIKKVEQWQNTKWRQLTIEEIMAAVRELTEAAIDAYISMVSGVLPAAWISEALFTAYYKLLVKKKESPSAPTFLLGFDSIPIQSDKLLFDIAQWAGAQEELSAYLVDTSSNQLAEDFLDNQNPGIDVAVWQSWQGRFRSYLDTYGSAIYNLDFSNSVQSDDPAPALEVIKLYLSGGGVNPYTRQQTTSERRNQAMNDIQNRLRGLRLRLFRKLVSTAQKFAPLREDSLAILGLAYPTIREMLHEVGSRFANTGMIPVLDDIYWLEQNEIEDAIGRLEHGEKLANHSRTISYRKTKWRSTQKGVPPMGLMDMKIFGKNIMELKDSDKRTAKNTIKGVAASPGCISGPACVMKGPEDFHKMITGDVLVAAITTPAWTPLFARAAAIVTDVGGPLSHGSIVAREYGIPAVLGTGEATRRIQQGQKITVDGSKGIVTLSNNKDQKK